MSSPQLKSWVLSLALLASIAVTPASGAFDLNRHGLSGSWFKPATVGQGVEIEVYQDLVAPGTGFLQGAWFTFNYVAPDGPASQRWYTFSGNVATGQPSANLTLYENVGGNFNALPVTAAMPIGSVVFSATDCTHASMAYTFTDGSARSGTIDLIRLLPNVTCSASDAEPFNPDFGYSGNWYNTMTSGQGLVFELNSVQPFAFFAWYTYATNGQALGEAGQRWYTGQASYAPGSRTLPMTLYETTGGLFDSAMPPASTVAVGTATATFASCSALRLDFTFTGGSSAGSSGSIDMSRVGPAPLGCGTIPTVPQVRISGTSPFALGCDGAPAVGTLYVNAEVEPMIAVNPRNANNVIAVWQQDRWSNGGARGLLAGVSQDGGHTWATRMAAFSRCTGGSSANGGDYPRASDPWVSFGPDGAAYQSSLSFAGDVFAPGSSSAILVSRSADGGTSWSDPAILIRDGSGFFNDKDSLTADPTDARFVYAVWDRLVAGGGGPSYLARSTDGGATWEPARPIYDPGPTSQTINNQIVVLPNGVLIDFFTQLDAPPGAPETATLAIIRSLDKGVSWSAPIAISPVQSVGTVDPQTQAPVRDASDLGSIAAGTHGELVAVWQDSRFSGGVRDGIAFSRSLDGGVTWSTPTRVNRDAAVAAFVPAVTVRGDGTYGVTYYDFRNNTSDPSTLPTDNWLTQSTDGVTWLESHVAGPFDLAIAPVDEGLFLGDYQGLSSAGALFLPLYAETNDGQLGNRTDIYVSLAGSAGAAQEAQTHAARVTAQSAEPLPSTPELQRKIHESVLRTMQRRLPGWTPPADVPSAPSTLR